MNGYYSEYLDNIKFLIDNKDKLTEKAATLFGVFTIRKHDNKKALFFAKWLRFLIDATYKAKVLAEEINLFFVIMTIR